MVKHVGVLILVYETILLSAFVDILLIASFVFTLLIFFILNFTYTSLLLQS